MDFIAFKVDISSVKIYIVGMDIVNDVTYSRKSVNTRVVITIFITRRYSLLITGKKRRHMIYAHVVFWKKKNT